MTRQHPRLVAWKTPDELRSVKYALYPAGEGPDRRQWALDKICAWSTRTRLPHAIEATSMLTAAIFHDIHSNPTLTRRLTYSTAICRFVNGLLDPAQQSQFAVSMHTLARNLSLPASFVEIRHAATHEALPSLEVLRTVANRALEWLWTHYWASLEDGREVGKKDLEMERARIALKRWRRVRRDNPLREIKTADESEEGKETVKVIRECISICESEEGVEMLAEALLEEKGLVPVGKKKTPLMAGAFLLWIPLLEQLDTASKSFSKQLASSILEALKTSSSPFLIPFSSSSVDTPSQDQEYLIALQHWLQCLTAPTSKISKSLDLDSLLESCVLTPNGHTMKFTSYLLENHPALKQKYGAIAEMAQLQILPDSSFKEGKEKKKNVENKKRSLDDVEEELANFEARYEEMLLQRKQWEEQRRGVAKVGTKFAGEGAGKGERWKKWEGPWVPKPIGIV